MNEEELVLCGASAYNKKFYFNENFAALPEEIQKELKVACVLFTEDVGGILQMIYDEDGSLQLRTSSREDDYLYDDIGAALKIKALQNEKRELFESLELFYRVFFLGEE